MNLIDLSGSKLNESEGVFTLKNNNTTIGFVRFNNTGEVEYIFVNPFFRKKKNSKKTFKIGERKNTKKTNFSKTY